MSEKSSMNSFLHLSPSKRIFPSIPGDKSLNAWLEKAQNEEDASRQGTDTGDREHPFDMDAMLKLKRHNVHHSACVDAKVSSTVGMGFEAPPEFKTQVQEAEMNMTPKPREPLSKAEEVLNPLCQISFLDVLKDMAEDYISTGNGYMEVVRSDQTEGAPITGIHHIPCPRATIFVEDRDYNFHYKIQSEGATQRGEQRFARFGDMERFLAVNQGRFAQGRVSEVIHFRRSTSFSKWYGMPDWLSAVASIELVQALTQHNFDFFLNRGVPELILFVLGQKLAEPEWKEIRDALKATIGLKNQHKTAAFNIPNPETKIQLEKLGMESQQTDLFSDFSNTLALQICSAHRTPALLAGIQLPGKMAASNELPNALMAFQLLTIGPEQKNIETILDCTLGDSSFNGGLGLQQGDFSFKSITDQLDLGKMDTMARMRQTLPEAQEEGRDLEDGLKKILKDAKIDEASASKLVGRMLAAMAKSVLEAAA